jgi:hypothetical protein
MMVTSGINGNVLNSNHQEVKGKGHPITGHEGAEVEERCSYVLYRTLVLDWVVNAMPWPLYPRERSCTHCIGGWVGPGAGLDRYRNLDSNGI